jgi:hypothetical protein
MKPTEIAERFAKDIANHEIEIIKNDGAHRHVKCASTGEHKWNQWFEIVTWPGCLAYNGDMGSYMFTRLEDMFDFFRRNDGQINPGYWAEKCVSADRDKIKKFSVDKFRKNVIDAAKEYCDVHEKNELPNRIRKEITELLEAEDEYDCVSRLRDFDSDLVEFNDFWEVSNMEYTHRFIWCLHAIVWTIAKFDAQTEHE